MSRDAGIAVPSRPYAKIKGSEPSVTTILGTLDKPGLSWGAAKETALFAIHHQEEWIGLPEDQAYTRLRTHHKGVWDSAAALGTLVHSVAEKWAHGKSVDVSQIVGEMAESDPSARSWKGHELEVVGEAMRYVEDLANWWEDHVVNVSASEAVVRTPGVCIGQTDLRALLQFPGGEVRDSLIDFKTTREQDLSKHYYPDSWALQLAAYNFSPEQVIYEMEGGRPVEAFTLKWTPASFCGIVQLRGNGEPEFFPMPVDRELYECFLSIAQVNKVVGALKKSKRVTVEDGLERGEAQ